MKNGDLILLNFTAKVKDTGDIIETTVEEEGKKIKKYDDDFVFKPILVAIGAGWVLKGLEEALVDAEVGIKIDLEISPEKGFGLRDASKTRLLPLRKFRDKADQLNIGSEIEVNGRIGIIRFIGSGRAQIDFNHKYAGRILEYNFTIVKKIEDIEEKIKEIIDRRIPNSKEKVDVKVEQNKAIISIPEEYFMLEGLQIIKRAIANDMMKYVDSVTEISFVEQFKNEKKETKDVEQSESTQETKDVEQSESTQETKDVEQSESTQENVNNKNEI